MPQDISDIAKLDEVLLALCEQVSYRLRKQKLLANVVNVQIKTSTFDVYTNQKKLLDSTDSTKYIYKEAKGLLLTLYNSLSNKQIRLLGVRVDNLVDEEEMQMSLFMNNNGDKERQKRVDYVVDELKDKYGYNMVTRAGKMNINKLIRLKE